ncbi:MAG: hypothetical protein IT257_12580 [Chitinophagaceae bacterium]|nr:hypothetical protein [Chitinophagaceae bacterium]
MHRTAQHLAATDIKRQALQEITRISSMIEQSESGRLLYISSLFEQYKSILLELHQKSDRSDAECIQPLLQEMNNAETEFFIEKNRRSQLVRETKIKNFLSESLKKSSMMLMKETQ